MCDNVHTEKVSRRQKQKVVKKSKPYRKSIKRPTNTPSNENDAWNRKRKKNTS